MDDHDTGISGAAGYLLGRMAAESAQDQARLRKYLRSRFSRPVRRPYEAESVDRAIAEWQEAVRSRDATIQGLREQGAAVVTERDQWRDYARAVEGEREALRTQASALQDNKFRLLDRVVDLEAENSGLLEDVEMLRAEVARLRNGTD
ncbi:hypothetical protein RGI145_22565 (plasmid) [Roseomonas gilardii]|uniref:Uncharacterized protein n=1 Tax=Roseomonas gilardii TaxID=257708 RepID=A0A1L7AN18_9PROT|nr:hypothetical protein RGI145_22565 [Roseomonas gilardii]